MWTIISFRSKLFCLIYKKKYYDDFFYQKVNKPHVGETEKLLLALCNRAFLMPHVLCCISIDEVDGLVPKRDEK